MGSPITSPAAYTLGFVVCRNSLTMISPFVPTVTPISSRPNPAVLARRPVATSTRSARAMRGSEPRSEEHTSELQSRLHLVCRLLLEKKKKNKNNKKKKQKKKKKTNKKY